MPSGSPDRETGAIVYYAALHAEKTRHELFEKEAFPARLADLPSGRAEWKAFHRIARCRSGYRRAAGSIRRRRVCLDSLRAYGISVEMGPPQRLRDTLWAPALVQAAPSFHGMDLGEVLIPAIYPFSWKQRDEQVWLGRMTEWLADEEGREYPTGQKILLVDGEEVPFLEVRST